MQSDITNIQELWQSVLSTFKTQLSESQFKTWFEKVHALRLDDNNCLVLGTENNFTRDWIMQKYQKQIASEVAKRYAHIKHIKIITSRRTAPPQKAHQISTPNTALPIESIEKKNNLNPRFTFKNFYVAPCNEYAHAAAQVVATRLGIAYNPCFIYGASGCGKTHLIQAIGNKVAAMYPNMNVRYITAEAFTDAYVQALRTEKMHEFRKEYQNTQLLILDDVHFFQKKIQTAVELFHLFNHLHNNNWQIVFAADCHPNLISEIEDRVRTRFAAGMILDINSIDNESMMLIAKKKAEQMELNMDAEVFEYIIKHVNTSVRELEGVFKSLALYQEIQKKPLTLSNVQHFIKNNLKPHASTNQKDIIEKICEFYEISPSAITSKSRKQEFVLARQMIMYVMRECLDISFATIGAKMGGRDHTTTMHACEKIKKRLTTDRDLVIQLEKIKRLLNL